MPEVADGGGTSDGDGGVKNATDPEILSRAEMEGRRQALEYARFLVDRVPGYENASLIAAIASGSDTRLDAGSSPGVVAVRRLHEGGPDHSVRTGA